MERRSISECLICVEMRLLICLTGQNFNMDYYSDYEGFLKETADEVGCLISYKKNLSRFHQQARLFVKQYKSYSEAVKRRDENIPTDPRLRDCSKGAPEPGWIWCSTLALLTEGEDNGYWKPGDTSS